MTDTLKGADDDAGLAVSAARTGRNGAPAAPATSGSRPVTAPALRYLIAGLSAAAGVIHLAMVPSHMAAWAIEGVAFAVVGWLQLAAAVMVLIRPSRLLVTAAAVAHVGFVAAWALTRTVGWPLGPAAGLAEEVSLVDLATVALEAAVVLLAMLALIRPALATLSGVGARRGGMIGAVSAVVLATVVLTSPSARDHGHSVDDDAVAPAGGHDHHDEAAAGVAAAPIADDRGLGELSNGHHDEMVVQDLDAETQAELDAQLAITREVAARYPTVAAAEAAGYSRIGPYFPGIGAHYGKNAEAGPLELNEDGVLTDEEIAHPFTIIYDGTDPDSRVAGFMYLSMAGADEEPEGFKGPNDLWHYHESLCLDYAPGYIGEVNIPFGLDHEATEEECTAAGGEILGISPWMTHVWSAPGWDDDPDVGIFGEFHTDLTCSDGTYWMLPVEQWVDHQRNVCAADAA